MQSWQTHEVDNIYPLLENYNLYTTDVVLQDIIQRQQADWSVADLSRMGAELGTSEVFERGRLANTYPPVLKTFSRTGHRIDQVDFHPAWHDTLRHVMAEGVHTAPWASPRAGAHTARAAAMYLFTQSEAGSMCPTTMTYGVIPTLARDAGLARDWLPTLFSREHDPRDLPFSQKRGGMIGMGMTEKQGGSDVRTNTTRAERQADGSYRITGHKWFFSAPMCDAHLVLAQTEGGLSCFFLPRWAPDGSKNPIQIQRLKEKVGNRSNSSSEVEFHGAWGQLLGEPGRGVPLILEMGNYTRHDCGIGTAGMMRQALSQAIHYTRQRRAFGQKLIDQPLMQNVLADLALETEAATRLAFRLSRAIDAQTANDDENLFKRLITPAVKYWVCKRGPMLSAEAMEVHGGVGYVEEGIQGRIFREMPVNSIWEGSGNVMCLDTLRALQKAPQGLALLQSELAQAQGRHPLYDAWLGKLLKEFADSEGLEGRARRLNERLALALQAKLMLTEAREDAAEAFVESRLSGDWGQTFGTLSWQNNLRGIIDRASLIQS